MEHVEEPSLLLGGEGAWVPAALASRPVGCGAAAVVAVVGGPAHAECRTGLDPSNDRGEFLQGLVAGGLEHGRERGRGHWFFSPFWFGALSVASWSSSAESFPWTAMTVRALAGSA